MLPMSSTRWRCLRFCTSTEQWISRLCPGDGPILWGACVCSWSVWLQSHGCRNFEGDSWPLESRDEFGKCEWKTVYIKFESVGTPAHMNVQVWMSGLRRAAWQAVWRAAWRAVWRGAACASEGRVHVVAEGIANPWHPVSAANYLCDFHNEAVCSDRGQRWLSDQEGEL